MLENYKWWISFKYSEMNFSKDVIGKAKLKTVIQRKRNSVLKALITVFKKITPLRV